MSPEKQCIAIAETHGLPNIHFVDHVLVYGGEYPDVRSVPDYPNDLNAMHEAIKAQPVEIQWMVFARLADIVSPEIPAYMGTAAQYAEAFLRTVGKWEEAT